MPPFTCFLHIAACFATVELLEVGAIRTFTNDALASELAEGELSLEDIAAGPKSENSWLLAGLAALIPAHSDLIKQVFLDTGTVNELGHTVYKLRFWIDGQAVVVAVDDVFPSNPDSEKPDLMFTAYRGKLWPALIEKGLAKIFASYYTVRTGAAYEVFQMIAAAPVNIVNLKGANPQMRFLKRFVQGAFKNKWPVTMDTGPATNRLGYPEESSYVVLDMTDNDVNAEFKVYDAARRGNICPKLVEGCLKDEYPYFWVNFQTMALVFNNIARAELSSTAINYQVTTIPLPLGEQAFQFTAKTDDVLSTTIHWPTEKRYEAHTRYCYNTKLLAWSKVWKGNTKNPFWHPFDGEINYYQDSRVAYLGPAGKGVYTVLTTTDYIYLDSLKNMTLSIYHEGPIENFHAIPFPKDQVGFLQMSSESGSEANATDATSASDAVSKRPNCPVSRYSELYCSKASMPGSLQRIYGLDNFDEMAKENKEDSIFPPTINSIGTKLECSEAETHKDVPCENYNHHWESFTKRWGNTEYKPVLF
mmetsp:Transcript_37823/g.80079  ORF Transcript_37823/g.80079 Transcript_37823/m.80079 type:complete len:532 (-) Transcript_37823:60-1655(-)